MDAVAPLRPEPGGGRDGLLAERVVLERDEHALVLHLLDPERRQRLNLHGLGERQILMAPVEDVESDPEHHPATARQEGRGLERHGNDPGGESAEAPEDGGQRHLEPERPEVEGRLPRSLDVGYSRRRSQITEACAIVNESIAPNEYIVARNVV